MSKMLRRAGRVRLQPYVPPELAERLSAFCAATSATESGAVQAALGQYLDQTGDMTLLLRRLDRLGRAGERTQRDLELLSQAFAFWLRLWFASVPNLAQDAKASARITAENRYKHFVEHLAEQFAGGKRFLDDLPRESVGDDSELAALAQITDCDAPNRAGGC
jgi:hypothetical protein